MSYAIWRKIKTDKRLKILIVLIAIVVVGFLFWFYRVNILNKPIVNAEVYIESQMQSCYKKPGSKKCYQTVAINLLARYSLPEILEVFDKNEDKPEFFENCHEVAHYLGQQEYKRVKDVKKVLMGSNRVCLGGTYHGAVEGYFMENKISTALEDREVIEKAVSTICGEPEDYIRLQDFTECNHGLGHAVMFVTDNNLPLALDYCDATKSQNERELCYTGALMANGDSFKDKDHPTQYIKDDDPLYPCNILKQQQQKQCYTYGVLTRFQYDLPKSISICENVPAEFQNDCFGTIGRDRTMTTSDPSELKSQCGQVKEERFRKKCISGTSYNLVVRFGLSSDIPAEYCRITDSTYKNDCYQSIFDATKNVTNDKALKESFCVKISETNYQKQCLNYI